MAGESSCEPSCPQPAHGLLWDERKVQVCRLFVYNQEQVAKTRGPPWAAEQEVKNHKGECHSMKTLHYVIYMDSNRNE